MATRATARHYTGTPTELIVVTGTTDAGREVEMIIPTAMAIEILTRAAEAYAHADHIGHAIWHVKNDNEKFDGCSSCKIKDEYKYMVAFEAKPNHDFESGHAATVNIEKYWVRTKTLKEASIKCREFIDNNDLGGGNWTGGDVILRKTGKQVAYISYNGRIWEGKGWKKGAQEITEEPA